MQQSTNRTTRKQTESLDRWLARHPLLAPLHAMHTRMKEQYRLSEEATAQLIHAVDHPNPKVRWWCAHELDHLATPQSLDALIRLTQDRVPKVRAEAVHALGCERCKQCELGVDTAALMIDFMLTDPDVRVRGAALHALGYLPADARAARALQQVAENPSNSSKMRRNAQHKLKYHILDRDNATVEGLGK